MQITARVAFIGIGAVGGAYAMQFQENARDTDVFAITRNAAKYRQQPMTVNGRPLTLPVYTPQPGLTAEYIFLCVKWHDFPAAMETVSLHINSETQIISLLNGVESEQALIERFGEEHVMYGTCFGLDSYREGHDIFLSSLGAIHFGKRTNTPPQPAVLRLQNLLEAARIPCRIGEDMPLVLWRKLLVNVGMNQVSAVLKLPYGEFRRSSLAMQWMRQAQQEVILVAQREGIALTPQDQQHWEQQLQTLSEAGRSSMLQDVLARRKTEVELYGQTICRLGEKHHIPTPVNAMLCEKIDEIESAYL